MHVILRSSIAKGKMSFLSKSHSRKILSIINKNRKRFGIRIYSISINSNHIHILLKLQYRNSFAKFMKSISSIIARFMLGVKKGKAKSKQFWDNRPYSRIVEWGKAYYGVKAYILQNIKEAKGLCEYKPRKINTKQNSRNPKFELINFAT